MKWDSLIQGYHNIRRGHGIKDSLTLITLSGLIGTLLVDLSNALLWRKGKTEMLYGHFAASMFMRPFRTNQKKNFWLGQIFHMFTGIHFAFPIFYLLKKTGRDNLFLKGMIGGSVVWSSLYAFGVRMKMYLAKPHLTKTHYSYLWHNVLYGVATAYSMVWLAEPGTFPEGSQTQTLQSPQQSTNEMTSFPAEDYSIDPNKAESYLH